MSDTYYIDPAAVRQIDHGAIQVTPEVVAGLIERATKFRPPFVEGDVSLWVDVEDFKNLARFAGVEIKEVHHGVEL